MDVVCCSDLHGFMPKLEGGDLLIVAGDLTGRDEDRQHVIFCEWLEHQQFTQKVVIAGNHDSRIKGDNIDKIPGCRYLQDSGLQFMGFNIWGSPWTKEFPGMNPACKAFCLRSEEQLAEKWALIPDDTDILVTHSPAYGILDSSVRHLDDFSDEPEHLGSPSLTGWMLAHRDTLRLHVCGHIHESYGKIPLVNATCVNAAHCNGNYKPVNAPIRITL